MKLFWDRIDTNRILFVFIPLFSQIESGKTCLNSAYFIWNSGATILKIVKWLLDNCPFNNLVLYNSTFTFSSFFMIYFLEVRIKYPKCSFFTVEKSPNIFYIHLAIPRIVFWLLTCLRALRINWNWTIHLVLSRNLVLRVFWSFFSLSNSWTLLLYLVLEGVFLCLVNFACFGNSDSANLNDTLDPLKYIRFFSLSPAVWL